MSTAEAAVALGVTERTVRRAIARGELKADKQGSSYRISGEEVERYAVQLAQQVRPAAMARTSELAPPDQYLTPLPVPLSSFVGREAIRERLKASLLDPHVRIVTLTGPGGVGKSRLSIATATSLASTFPDGVVYVALAAVAQPDLVIPTVADALGVQEVAGRDREQQVNVFLRHKRLLLLLDNFEQILDAAPAVARLAAEAARLKVLVTSRAPLRIRGEHELPVPPLDLAREQATPDELMASDAGRLFIVRAREHQPSLIVDDTSAPLIADICARLDGLPLAIELAAARVNVLPPPLLHRQLQHRLPLLTDGPRDMPLRHVTMRDAIAWSYDLLSPESQRLFRRLSVFVGGWTLDAAEAVGLGNVDGAAKSAVSAREVSPETVAHLASLVDQSLVTVETGGDGESRYRMLETIREFARERLEPDEEQAVRSAHARYFLDLAWSLRPLVNTLSTWAPLDRLTAHDGNLRAALQWFEADGQATDFARMVSACYTFMFARSHFREAEHWLDRAVATSNLLPDVGRALLMVAFAELLMVKGRFAQAITVFVEAIPLMRVISGPLDLALALVSSGAALNYDGKYREGEDHLREALTLVRTLDAGRLAAAIAARALANLSVSARGCGDLDEATVRAEEAYRLCQENDLELAASRTLMDLGDIAKDRGDIARAVPIYLACIEHVGERGELRLVAGGLSGIASGAAAWGQDRSALLLFGAASALRERIGFEMLLPVDTLALDQDLAALYARLGQQEAGAILREGRALSLVEAFAVAATVMPPGASPPLSGDGALGQLTPRQRDVLRLLVLSRTDREIAEELFLSQRTVNGHVRAILTKLGARTRRDAIAQFRDRAAMS